MEMSDNYEKTGREIIRTHNDKFLVKVSGSFMDSRTIGFEFWTSKEAYDRKQYRDGEKIYCSNWAVSEETALADWEKIIGKEVC